MAYKTKHKKKRQSRNAKLLENSVKLIAVGTALSFIGRALSRQT